MYSHCEDTTPGSEGELQDNEKENSRELTYLGTRITTLEELLVYAKVDRGIWEVKRFIMHKREKGAEGPDGSFLASSLFQFQVWLRRRLVEPRIADVPHPALPLGDSKGQPD